ncbi:segregation and condensation protein B [Bhargavaea cecembensis]|uniref:Segregation and condensation protein B n=1 Tax=Bhargavaea cecembensis TaxID=394098 RepID=A0A161SKQ6_9BACL|nr:SMC-Scp complex subunit ScpB [Bhargavaea cecembensis]KZE38093.1 segregation and condensation protein B [Bhargavaea cecembensis]
MENGNQLAGQVESLLFVAGDDGLTAKQLAELTGTDKEAVERALAQVAEACRPEGRGLQVVELAGTFRLATKQQHADAIRRLLENPTTQALTQASLEVLAIIAYRQPITRVEVEEIRGVKSERPIQTLVSRGLVKEAGRAEGTGRAILYGTTDTFLDHFGLASLKDLPPLNDSGSEAEDEELDLFMSNFTEAFDEEGTEE